MASRIEDQARHANGYAAEPVGREPDTHGGWAKVRVTVGGTSPLLMNCMSQEDLLNIYYKRKAPKTKERAKPADEAANRLYLLPDGRPHVPVKNFYKCLITAGQYIRLDGKRMISSAKSTHLPGMALVLDATLPLSLTGGKRPATWQADIQQGRNPNGGEAVCIIRPRFDEWEFECTLEVNRNLMAVTTLRELLDIAGSRIGLMDFRPERKGTFGRWNVVNFSSVKE